MSAIIDNPMNRLRETNPEAWNTIYRISEVISKSLKEAGLPGRSIEQLMAFEITITDDMTEEEIDMQYIQYYLRRGHELKKAEELAKAHKARSKEIFEMLDSR